TSPLDSNAILFAKWLGAVVSVRWSWLWLGTIWGLGVLTGGLHIAALPLVMGAWAVFAGFLSMLGLWFSVVSRTSLRATVWTILTTVGISIGHWLPWMCCVPMMVYGGRGLEYIAKFQAGLTPPFVLGFMAFSGEEFRDSYAAREFAELIGFCLFGTFAW